MERNNSEATDIEISSVEVLDHCLCELSDLQLTQIGGGVGETVLS